MKTLHFAAQLLLIASGILLNVGETKVIEESPGSMKRGFPPLPADMKLTPPLTRDLVPGQRAITVPPLNTHTFVGGTVTLWCEAQAPSPMVRVLWFEHISSSEGRIISDNAVIIDSTLASRARIIQPQPNHFYLQISNISFSDAGRYSCMDIYSGPPEIYKGEMQLVVLGSNPNCKTTVPSDSVVLEGQTHTYTCEISYKGNMKPDMYWTGWNTYQRTDDVTDTSVSSTISLTVDRSMDTASLRCQTYFTPPPPPPPPSSSDAASNAPAYYYLYQFQPLYVYWPPKSMSAYPMKSLYSVGEEIFCQADSFPISFYQWQNLETLELFNQQTFTITSNMAGLVTRMKCTAMNLINSVVYREDLTMEVRVEGSTLQES